jgi:hypothetical protein
MEPRTQSLGARRSEVELPLPDGPIAQPILVLPERRPRSIDRTALCVQITLCIVVSVLLFSVIALPKLRSGRARIGDVPAVPTTTRGR